MVFSSVVFLFCFLPVLLFLYFVVPDRWRNMVLLVASMVFYAWGAPGFLPVLVGTTVATFYLVGWMARQEGRRRRVLCAVSCAVCLVFLLYFKYANFVVDNVNGLLSCLGSEPMAWVAVALPVGISFYTFQSITYVVDVYRGSKPMERLGDFMLYVMMFPQLVAGPIVRYDEISGQIRGARRTGWETFVQGWYRFAIGLSKKVLVADVLGKVVDVVLDGGGIGDLGMGQAWLVLTAYAMQLYFDFSGYCDMAIGLGRMFGFSFPENFNNPYTSASVSEFWRRWHITLGRFMMDYLYIPLGGNRRGRARMFANLWVVFLLSGIWHGAGWNFVAWGAYHGFFIAGEKLLGIGGRSERVRFRMVRVMVTFVVVALGWTMFRIDDWSQWVAFVSRLFCFHSGGDVAALSSQFVVVLVVALLFSFITLFSFGRRLEAFFFEAPRSSRAKVVVWLVCTMLFVMSVATLAATDFSPFIYFRF